MNKTVSITTLPSATGFGPGDSIVGVHEGNASLFPYELIGAGGAGSTGPTGPTGPIGEGNLDRLSNGNLELILDSKGTLNTPLLLPVSFTAICDELHMIDSVTFEGSNWWEFEVEFQISTYGTVAVMINNIFPILTNPGYTSGYTFRFTEADHGIPNYNFDITLNDVVLPGDAGWTSNLSVSQSPVYPSTIESSGAIKITSNSNSIILGTDGVLYIPKGIEFPLSNGNNRTGEGNNLQFEKGSAFQKIISTQDGNELVPTVERLVISGGDSYNNEGTYTGEGGDIYLWAGKGANGGDIKVDAGESTSGQGGTIKIRSGYSESSIGGFVEISSGYGGLGGGDISITASGGGTGIEAGGEISMNTVGGSWTFKNDGGLRFPNGSTQNVAYPGADVSVIELLYSELTYSISEGNLVRGAYYLITDFKTCYDQPDYDHNGTPITTGNYKEGEVSPIMVFATSTNQISELAYQPEYPGDTIHYEVGFSATEVTGSPAFGRITYRKDKQGNSFDYDFREVLFKRYDAYVSEYVYDGTVSIDSSGNVTGTNTIFTNFIEGDIIGILNNYDQPLVSYYQIVSIADNTNMVVTGNVINSISDTLLTNATLMSLMSWKKSNIISNTNSAEYLTFENYNQCYNNTCSNTLSYTMWNEETFFLPNNVFRGGRYVDNSFGSGFRNNTFNDDCISNTIKGDFYNNVITNDFDWNNINDSFYNNVIECDFQNNLIMDSFYNNNLGDDDGIDFSNNTIMSSFSDNFYLGWNDFTNNIINGYFGQNRILRGFSNNTTGDFSYNVLKTSIERNNIGNYFSQNTIDNGFYDNVIGNNFQQNTIGASSGAFENNRIGTDFKGNLITGQFQDNIVGNNFIANQIDSYFNSNTVGNFFFINDIGNDFRDNFIMDNFESNQIGNNFRNNRISNNFYNNDISNDFGFGGGTYRGNIIGNNFYNNNIDAYFYDNNIGDSFAGNTIGKYFQFNKIETSVVSTDFVQYLGNITGVTYDPITGTDGTYSGISALETSGGGVNAVFEVTVSGGFVSNISLTSSGQKYQIGDTVTLSTVAFNGSGPLVLTVSSISADPMVYGNYNKTIQRNYEGTIILTAISAYGGLYISQYITQAID